MEVKVDTATAPTPSAWPPAELARGTSCGDWVIEASIGSGGFGHVYRARHRASSNSAAIKVLRAELGAFANAVGRFEQEAQIFAAFSHEGLPRMLDFARLPDGRPFMVMELLEGEDLKQRLGREGRLPLSDALTIVGRVVEVLDTVHARGVIHRDIKPSNIFLASVDGATRVVVLDFGLGKLLDEPGQLTASRQLLGTPASMAPEQVLGQPVDARTDVYALGCLMFQMLAGRPPFEHDSVEVLCQMHVHARVPAVSSVLPQYRAFDSAIGRAMGKRADERYASARELLAALHAAGAREESGPRAASLALVCVEVFSEHELSATTPSAVFDDFEGVLSLACAQLQARGACLALRAGNMAALYVEYESGWRSALRARRALRRTLADVRQALHERRGARHEVAFSLRASSGRGTLQGESLLASELLERMLSGAGSSRRSSR